MPGTLKTSVKDPTFWPQNKNNANLLSLTTEALQLTNEFMEQWSS